jgi:hypothetical protein
MTKEAVAVAAAVMVVMMVMLEAVAGLPPCWSRYCHHRLRVTSQVRSKAGISGFSFRALSISATEFRAASHRLYRVGGDDTTP